MVCLIVFIILHVLSIFSQAEKKHAIGQVACKHASKISHHTYHVSTSIILCLSYKLFIHYLMSPSYIVYYLRLLSLEGKLMRTFNFYISISSYVYVQRQHKCSTKPGQASKRYPLINNYIIVWVIIILLCGHGHWIVLLGKALITLKWEGGLDEHLILWGE